MIPGFASQSEAEVESHTFPLRMASGENAGDSTFEKIELCGQRCREGDLSAWTTLFPLVWPVLLIFINRLYHSLDEQDAEDVAQSSIEAAIGGIDSFSGEGLFRAWLFGIASQQARTLFRRKSAAKRGLRLLVPMSDATDAMDAAAKSPAEASAENDRAAILHRALEQLAEDERDLVHLHYFGELTFREIAVVRGMNPKTVCTRLTRAKDRLLELVVRSHLTRVDG